MSRTRTDVAEEHRLPCGTPGAATKPPRRCPLRGSIILATAALFATAATAQVERGLPEHTGDIMGVAFSDNGKHAVSVGKADLVVWDATTWTAAATFDLAGIAADVGDDGKTLALTMNTASLLTLGTDEAKRTFPADGQGPSSMALQLGKTGLFYGTTDGKLVRLDRTKQTPVWSVDAHDGNFLGLAVTSDEKLVATCGKDKTVKVWDGRTGAALRRLEGHGDICETVGISDDGKVIVSGGPRDTIFWGPGSDKPLESLYTPAIAVAVTRDGRRAAIAGQRGLLLWDPATMNALASIGGVPFKTAAFSPDGRSLATTAEPKAYTLRVYDVDALVAAPTKTAEALRPFVGHDAGVLALVASRDGKTLLSSDKGGRTKQWDLAKRRVVRTVEGRVVGITARGDAFGVRRGNAVVLVDPRSGAELATIPVGDDARGVGLEPDGSVLVGTAAGLRVLGRDGSEKQSVVIDGGAGSVVRSADGKVVAVVSGATAKILDGKTLAEKKVLIGHGAPIDDVVLSGDGRVAVTFCNGEGKAIAWDTTKGTPSGELDLGSDRLRSVAVDPRGTLAAVGGTDGVVTLFATTGAAVKGKVAPRGDKTERDVGRGWSADIRALTFAPDGKSVLTGSLNRSIRGWSTASLAPTMRLAGFYEFGQLRDPTLERGIAIFTETGAKHHSAAVDACADGKDDDAVLALGQGGAMDLDFKVNGWTLLMVCAAYNNPKAADLLLKRGANPDIQRDNGETALTTIAGKKHLPIIKALLAAKANPNIVGQSKQTALMHSIADDGGPATVEQLQALLDAGANVMARGPSGATALHYAAVFGTPEHVRLLLSRGAQKGATDEDGYTPEEWATSKDRSDTAAALRSAP